LAVTVVAYFISLFRDPDRLQSEEYRLSQRELIMICGKGTNPEVVDPARESAHVESLPAGSAMEVRREKALARVR
jgi:hypothetical protein